MTLHAPIEARVEHPDAPEHDRHPWSTVFIAVVALLLGGVVGWGLAGSADDPSYVVVGGGEPNDRQEAMIDLFEDYTEAVLANDGSAVVAMFTGAGTWSGDVGSTLRVDDGTLETFVDTYPFSAPLNDEPVLIDGSTMTYVHRYSGRTYYDHLTFTETGEVQLIDHRILM